MSNEKLAEALRDLENRIIQRLAWLREGSLIDIQAFTADIEAMLLHLHAAEAAQALQARLDALMLEFCPDDMTDEQRAAWAARQKPVED